MECEKSQEGRKNEDSAKSVAIVSVSVDENNIFDGIGFIVAHAEHVQAGDTSTFSMWVVISFG